MKAEHRKELHTNILADHLGKLYEGVKKGPQASSNAVWVVVGLLVAVAAAWWYFHRTGPLPWMELQNATDQRLADLAKDHRGTPLARIARFQEARKLLENGQRLLAEFPEEALKDLADAGVRYEQLAQECTDDPILREEALLGAAVAEENQGHLDRAQELYERLAKAAPNSPWGQKAAAQAAGLAKEREKGGGAEIDFYQKFQAELAKGAKRPG
jgi:hypothetical protein